MDLPNLLLIDKPKRITSFDVIRQLRKATGQRKFGHAGTLDPLASGLMLIGVGQGTKLLTALAGLDKEYVAEILIGESRTTGDMEGEVVSERAYAGDLYAARVEEVLAGMCDTLRLPVSAYSAIKVGGQPLYKQARAAARRGKTVDALPLRDMVVYEAELLSFEAASGDGFTVPAGRLLLLVRFKVSSGTYIRSLAEELGRRLGYPAVLANLRRTMVGQYRVEDARTLDSFNIKS